YLPSLGDELPKLEDGVGPEVDQIGKYQDVGRVPGSNRTDALKTMVAGDVQRGQLDRIADRKPMGDRGPDHGVDVPLRQERSRLTVIGDEHAVVGPEVSYQWEKVHQVPDHRGFADHDPHAEPPLLERFLDRGALMIAGR